MQIDKLLRSKKRSVPVNENLIARMTQSEFVIICDKVNRSPQITETI